MIPTILFLAAMLAFAGRHPIIGSACLLATLLTLL
jgi:hypothetical protein